MGRLPRKRWWFVPVVLLLAVPLVLLATPWGVRTALRMALSGTGVSIEGARGSLVTGVTVYGVDLENESLRLRADTVRARYRMNMLMRGSVHLRQLEVRGMDLEVKAVAADSSEAEAPGSMSIDIASAGVYRSWLTLPLSADTSVQIDIRSLEAAVSLGHAFMLRVDTIDAAARVGAEPLRIAGRFGMAEGRVYTDPLRLFNGRTDVSLEGYLGLPADAGLRVTAAPLWMGDIGLLTRMAGADSPLMLAATVTHEEGLLHVTGEGTLPDDGRVTVDVRAAMDSLLDARLVTLRNVDLRLIDSTLTGAFTANLAGYVRQDETGQVQGAVDIQMLESTLAGLVLESGDIQAALSGDEASCKADLRINGTDIGLTGLAGGFGAEPHYALKGRFDGLDLASLGAPATSVLGGTIQVEGGAGGVWAHVHMASGALGALPLTEMIINARHSGKVLDINVSSVVGEGSLALEASLLTGAMQQQLNATLQLSRLDVAGMLARPETSTLTGRITAHARGAWPPDSGGVVIELTDSRFDVYEIDTMQVWAAIDGAEVHAAGRVDLAQGWLTWAGSGRLFDEVPFYTVTEARFGSVDVGAWAEPWHSDLNGTMQLAGGDGHRLTLQLLPSVINEQPVDSGRVELLLLGATLGGKVVLHMPQGGMDASFERDSTVLLAGSAFRDLDLGALLNLEGLTTRLSGATDTFRVTPRGLMASVSLEPSLVNQLATDHASIQVAADSGHYALKGVVDWEGGGLRLDTVHGRWFDAVPTYVVRGNAQNLDMDALLGMPAIFSGAVDIRGTGTDPATMVVDRAHVRAADSRYGDVAIRDFHAMLTLSGGMLHVDTMELRSSAVRFKSGGSISLFGGADVPRTLTVSGALLDAQALAALFGYDSATNDPVLGDTISLVFTSTGDTVFFQSRVQVSGATAGKVRVLDAHAGASGLVTIDSTGERSLGLDSVWAGMQRISIPGLAARSASANVSLGGDTLVFTATVAIDEARDVTLQGTADLQAQKVKLQQLDVNLGPERWHLNQESEITFGDEYRIRHFLLVEQDQEIALDGLLDLDGRQSLALTLFNFRPESVADLLGQPGLGGVINGDFAFSGQAASPQLNGSITAALEAGGTPVGTLDATVGYTNGRMSLDASLVHVDQSTLMLSGHYPVDLRLVQPDAMPLPDDVMIEVEADQFNIGWVEPFLDPAVFGDIEGSLSGDVQVSGTIARPQLSGSLTLQEGQLELPELGITPRSIAAAVILDGDSLLVSHLSAVSGGIFEARGVIGLADLTLGAFDLAATVDQFRIVSNAAYLAHVTGDVQLSGTTRMPKLTGSIRLTNTDIRPMEAVGPVYGPTAFTEDDVRMLERYFSIRVTGQDTTTFVFYDALSMDLSVVVGDGVWLRSRSSPEMNIPFQGVLDLTKAAGGDQQVLGTVRVVPAQAYVRQFGRRFDIETGRLTFAGPMLNPLVDLRASYEPPSRTYQENPVKIYLDIEGSFLDEGALSLQLSSDPATLDESDIVSYIATGHPASEALQMSEGSTFQVGRDIAISRLSSLIAGVAGAGLGLDVVEIEQEGSRGVTLTVGKHISQDLSASVSWPIVVTTSTTARPGASPESTKQITIEYSLLAWLLARLRGDTSSVGASLVFQYAY